MQRLILALLLAGTLAAADLKIGIIGLDTSHVTAFTELLNNASNPKHIAGARVVAAYRGGSPDVEASYTRLDKFTAQLKTKYGVEIVPDIASLVQKVDAVLLESVDGRVHLEQVRPVFAAHKRVFIDKPLASTYADAKEIARLGRETGTPWFSASSERYNTLVTEIQTPPILGAITWGPSEIEPHHQLELSWYGIHAVEMLYALMGTGCESVTSTSTPNADLVVGRWKDGRLGAVRAGRGPGYYSFGAVVYTPQGSKQAQPTKQSFYPNLLADVVKFFETGVAPVPNDETLEEFAFMDAAQRSKDAGGTPMRLQ
ncbi:MAG TPA: Gfo/Idh/MocA family oxidoreductase [Bryobacterales bacterium]|nr:Gfo/Idh/MocA family oxidoreductase [Bryobacterales bacterium]